MDATRQASGRRRERQIGAAIYSSVPRLSPLRFSNRQLPLLESCPSRCKQTVSVRSNRQFSRRSANSSFQISNFKFRMSVPVSTRQCCRVEIAVSHSKQRIGTPATRQYFRGSAAVISKSAISNFECSVPQKSVNQNQVFPHGSRSKQTLGAQKGCQFFAMCFLARGSCKDAGLPGPEPTGTHTTRKNPALHSHLLRAAREQVPRLAALARDAHPDRMVILPTSRAVAYDTARSTRFGEGASHNVWVSPQYRSTSSQRWNAHSHVHDPDEILSFELKEERDGYSHPGSTAC